MPERCKRPYPAVPGRVERDVEPGHRPARCRRRGAHALAAGGPFNTPDQATFYGSDHRGYTDYPALTV
ncbi:hypothetical protein ACWIG5_13620 [Streptomyces lydicus]